MSPEAQRIAIAEACGWKQQSDKYYFDRIAWFHTSQNWKHATQDLPDYLGDLNAMHEAEKVLTAGQRDDYYETLTDVITHGTFFDDVHATAAQRAEAFLRTIGKWEPARTPSAQAGARK